MTAGLTETAPHAPTHVRVAPDPSTPVLQSQEATEGAFRAARMRQAKAAIRNVSEREFVQAVDRWLDGEDWEGATWAFAPYRGMVVRFAEDGDDLTQEGVAIVSRHPARLRELPVGTRTSRRVEGHALAAVAVRGDAGMYDRKPRTLKDR